MDSYGTDDMKNKHTGNGASGDSRLNRKTVLDGNYIDRYLLGHLNESESMAFEDFYASCPETMQELEESALLIDGLKASSEPPANIVSLTNRRAKADPDNSVSRVVASPWYGMAASLVAGIALLFAGGQYLSKQDVQTIPVITANLPVVTLGPSRGGEQGIAITKNQAGQIVLALDLGGETVAKSYGAVVQTQSGDFIGKADGLLPDEIDMLTMRITADALEQGDYRVVIRPENSAGSMLLFPFSIR
ncbi:MAG: anti-sigma factor [Woeseiaceae bacterium]